MASTTTTNIAQQIQNDDTLVFVKTLDNYYLAVPYFSATTLKAMVDQVIREQVSPMDPILATKLQAFIVTEDYDIECQACSQGLYLQDMAHSAKLINCGGAEIMQSIKLISLPNILTYIDTNGTIYPTSFSTLVQLDCYIYDIIQSSTQTIDKILNYAFLLDGKGEQVPPTPITFLSMSS